MKKAGGMGMILENIISNGEILFAMLRFCPLLLMMRSRKICLHFIGTKLIQFFLRMFLLVSPFDRDCKHNLPFILLYCKIRLVCVTVSWMCFDKNESYFGF